MKEQVINFLGQLPESNSEQFNQAMELFRKSKGHDAGQLRYYNTLGFSKDRLESLLYDLKMLHNITDLQVANAKRKSPLAPKGGKKEGANDAKKGTLQISAEELGTKELSEKFEDHISANQIDVNDAQDLSAPLEVTKDAASDTIITSKEERDAHEAAAKAERLKFLKEDLANFDLEAEKYNSIKSFAATLSDYLNEDPKDQKSETLKAFVAEAKKKYSQS